MSRSSKKKAQKVRKLVILGIFLACLAGGGYYAYYTLANKPEPVQNTDKTYMEKEVYPGQDERNNNEPDNDNNDNETEYAEPIKEAELEAEPSKEEPQNTEDTGEGYLEVHFIDVGQGDAALVMFVDTNLQNGDNSAAMLIDAGDENSGTLVRNYVSKNWGKGLDYFVCSHPDSDHIGGVASVVSNTGILSEKVFAPEFEKDTKVYENLLNEVSYKNYSYEMPQLFTAYELGLASFQFLAPSHKHSDANNSSLVLKVWYGDDSFLFVGDCEGEEELELINENGTAFKYVPSEVLKVGHHGSKSSTSESFLSLVSPKYAVISCGEGNSYGHPHAGALNNLRTAGVELFRTDVQGSIVAKTYGNGIAWSAEACNDWTPGE